MADNIDVTPSFAQAAVEVATDEIGGIHYPIYKGFDLEVAEGTVPGYSVGTVFGRNLDLDPAGQESIWDYGGLFSYLTADTEIFMSSTSTADVNVGVVINGMTDDYVLKNEIHFHTEGQSQHSIGNWFRIFKMTVIAGDAPVGDLYIAEADTLTGGEPDTASKVQGHMVAGTNTTHKAAYTVPAGYRLYITRLFLGTRRGEDAVFSFYVKPETAPAFIEASDFPTYQSTLFSVFSPPFVVTEKTDFEFRATTVTNNTQASANFGYILKDNTV